MGHVAPYPVILTTRIHKWKHYVWYLPSSIWFYHTGAHFFPSPQVACHCDHLLITHGQLVWLSFLYSIFAQLGKLPFTLLWLWLPTFKGPTWVILSGSMFLLPTLSNLFRPPSPAPRPYGSHCLLPKGNAQSMPF